MSVFHAHVCDGQEPTNAFINILPSLFVVVFCFAIYVLQKYYHIRILSTPILEEKMGYGTINVGVNSGIFNYWLSFVFVQWISTIYQVVFGIILVTDKPTKLPDDAITI